MGGLLLESEENTIKRNLGFTQQHNCKGIQARTGTWERDKKCQNMEQFIRKYANCLQIAPNSICRLVPARPSEKAAIAASKIL